MIPNPKEEGTFILGPSYVGEIPTALSLYYPKLGESDILSNSGINWCSYLRKSFPCWPTLDRDWKIWTTRMFQCRKDDLDKNRLKNVITLLRRGILQNPSLIQAALAFWDPSFNFFRYNCGMMAPTVLEVITQMLGLIPYGHVFYPSGNYCLPEDFIGVTPKNGSFAQFVHREMKSSDNVSDTELFTYILYTLYKYILCHSSKRVMSEFIPLVVALARGEEFDFAYYFLGNVYKVGSDFYQKGLNNSQGGSQWFIQLWLHAYFSELGPFKQPFKPNGERENANVHGDNYVQTVASEIQTLPQYLCFFFRLTADRDCSCPFFVSIGPPWLLNILADKGGKSSTALQAWGNIFTCREIYISSAKSKGHVEVYCPAQFARQLGLVQDIPVLFCGSTNISLSERIAVSAE